MWVADFETTVEKDQSRVWAYALCDINNTDTFYYGNSIDDFISWASLQDGERIYFHNLKFDGEFILSWLFNHGFKHLNDKYLRPNEFSTLISNMGQFYCIKVQFQEANVEFYDSLKVLPFKVKEIPKVFGLEDAKLEIDYAAPREIGHQLTQEEIDYIKEDVVIVAKALKILFDQNMTKMTTGANALNDFKTGYGKKNFERSFPTPSYDADIRKSYKGGFTYCNPKFQERDVGAGIVLDVNSLYPWAMYNCDFPIGEGIFFKGKYKPDKLCPLYVQMFTCNFKIKPNHIPTLQVKGGAYGFAQNEYLLDDGDKDVTLCLTCVDLKLFFDHYDVYNVDYHSGWKFRKTNGIFKSYIDKWMSVKIEASKSGNKGMRTLAKLMLNSLYGKFSTAPEGRSKIPYMEDGIVKYKASEPEKRNPLYIPIGSFITAYAREKTIRSAQTVYDRFMYADTDSLHLLGTDLPKNLEIDDTKLGAWKHEGTFVRARYIRQKSYVEEIIVSEKEAQKFLADNPEKSNLIYESEGRLVRLNVTCAGMPEACHQFVTWENFLRGSQFAGKLQPAHVKGGIVLKPIDFTIKG